MTWTYMFTGPEGVPTGHTELGDDEPGHVVLRERPQEEGVCDLYTLRERSDAFLTATYEWQAQGSPEEVMAVLAEVLPKAPGAGS